MRRFGSLFFGIGLIVVWLSLPSPLFAAALTNVTNTPWSSDISTSGKHTIRFTTVTSLAADGKIVITYPSGFTVSSAAFDSWSGIDGERTVSISGQVITITRDGTGTSSGAGDKYIVLSGITNHATATTYTVTVETKDILDVSVDGPTTSSNFTISATNDTLDTLAPWPTWLHDARNTSQTNNSGPAYPTLKWRFAVTDSSDNHRNIIQGSDGTLYYSSDSVLYALNEDGSVKWTSTNSHGTNIGSALTSSDRIYTYGTDEVLVARNTTDGSTIWTYTTALGGYWNSFNIAPDGTVVIADNSGLEGVNSDGTRKFLTTGSIGRDTTPAVDSSGNIYLTDDGNNLAYYPDGIQKWSASGGRVGNPASITANEASMLSVGRDSNSTLLSQSTTDGSTLWSIASSGSNYSVGALSPNSGTYYVNYQDTDLKAYSVTDGSLVWTNADAISGNWAEMRAVDADGIIYSGTYAVNTSGTTIWNLSGISGDYISVGRNNTVYYAQHSTDYIYAYGNWTLSATLDNTHSAGETVVITAESSMLKRDPAASTDNRVQLIMSNGDKVELLYDSTSGSNTIWKGTWTIPAGITPGAYSGTLQAITYNVTTDTVTSFNSLASSFNNTGLSQGFCYGVNAVAPTCGNNTIKELGVDAQPTSATFTWKTTNPSNKLFDWGETGAYGKTVNEQYAQNTEHSVTLTGLEQNKEYHYRIRAKNQLGFEVSTGDLTFRTARWASTGYVDPIDLKPTETGTILSDTNSLVSAWYTTPNSIPWEMHLAITPKSDADLLYGNTIIQASIQTPRSQGFLLVGDLYEYKATASFNGARFDKTLKPFTLTLKYDDTLLKGFSAKSVKIARFNENTNSWVVLPNIVVNTLTQQVSVATSQFGLFVPVILVESNVNRKVDQVPAVNSASDTKPQQERTKPSPNPTPTPIANQTEKKFCVFRWCW